MRMSWLKYLLKTLLVLLMWTVKRFYHLCNLKTCRSLIVIIKVYVVTFCVVLPFLCHDLPLTKYYTYWNDPKDIIGRAARLNQINADNAEKRLARLPKESTKRTYEQAMKEQKLRFVIAVQTIPRSGDPSPRYLTQVMVALHDVLEQEGRLSETALFMCHSQRPRDKEHVEAIALSEYFPLVVRGSVPGSDQDLYENEKQAYLFCLREAHKLHPDYVIILEDDTLPHTNFYSTLDYVLKHKTESQILRGELLRSDIDKVDWSWMKLNLPNNLMKYEGNYYFALEWVSISLIASNITILILVSLYRMNLKRQKVSVLLLFLVCFVYFMLITWVLGRSYITLPLTMSNTFYNLGPGTSCCTQAVLFPRKHLPDIMHYLETIQLSRRTPLDFALEDYRTKRNLRQFLINPNLCSHIGVISSLHGLPNHGVAENYLFAMENLKNILPTWFSQ